MFLGRMRFWVIDREESEGLLSDSLEGAKVEQNDWVRKGDKRK